MAPIRALIALVVGLVVLELAVALEVRGGQRVVQDLPRPVDGGARDQRVVVADLLLDRGLEGPALAPAGDDVDHPADGVGPVEGGLGAPDHLDALDQVRRDVREVHLPERRALHPQAVHQDLHLVGVGPADGHARGLAVSAGPADLHAGHAAERLVHGRVVIGLEVLAVHHADRGPELLDRSRHRGRRHHHRIHTFRLLRMRRQGRHQEPATTRDAVASTTPFASKGVGVGDRSQVS